MKIYRNGTQIQDVTHSDRATERKYLMDSHSVSIEFELSEHFQFLKGDNITIGGVSFSLPADYVAKHNQTTDGYRYQLEFFSREERWKDFVLKFEDLTEFPFTATGTQHLKLISDNLRDLGLGTFAYTSINEVRHIEYKDTSIFGALGLIAETFELEWWVSDNTINLGILSAGVPYPLEYGQELKSIDVSKSSEKLITRLYAYGGTKNMTSGKRLSMTVPYIDAIPDLPQSRIVEGVKYFDDIFPKQKNTITDIETYVIQAEDREHQDTTIFKIKDTKVAQLTQNDLLPEALMINFTSGLLMGREFELIIQDNGYYEIIYTQDGDIYYPNPTLKPQIGDEYFLSGFKAEAVLPGITAEAQAELKSKATEALQNIGSEYVYDVATNPVYCEQNDIDLNLGRTVSISSPTLGEFSSRIRGYEKNLLNKYDCKYQIGDSGLYSRIGELETKVEQPVKVVIDDDNVRQLTEVFSRKYLSKINPDTAAGHITFEEGLTAMTADIKDLTADTSLLNNITIGSGMRSKVFFPGFLGEGMELFKDENGNWNFTLDNLTVRKQMNVFELVINRIKHVGGAFLFSPAGGTFIDVEEHDTFWRCYVEDKNNNEFEIYDQVICQTFTKNRLKRYWRLAVNVGEDFVDLSKTDCESGSAYPEMDDEAVVLGNRVNKARQNAVLISSYGDDGSYQQFLNGVDTYSLADKIDIHFGKESFMRVNRLEIKGTDGKSERVPRDRGIFQLGETYEFYDRVVYNGRYWLCLAIKTTSAPSDGEWQEQTNVRAGGKNLLREHDLRFDGKYWQGSYDSQFIDLSMLSDYLFNGNNDAIVTEDNIYIEL